MRRAADMLASLGAAIWLRWELIRARRSRRAGGRQRDGELALPIMAVPVEGVDYEPLELEPELRRRLETTAAELVASVPPGDSGGAARRARPLRAVAATVGAVLAVAVVGASASALVAGTTGIPAMDRLLGIWESGLDRDTVPDRPGPTPADIRPERAGPIVEYSVDGDVRGKVTSFVGASRHICMANSIAASSAGAAFCDAPAAVARALDADGLHAVHLDVYGDAVMIYGQLAADVDAVSASGPAGPLEVVIGERWDSGATPEAMRPFVAVMQLTGAAARDGNTQATRWSQYSFEVERGGDSVTVSPRQRLR